MKLPDIDLAPAPRRALSPEPRRIAVLRANAVGDYVITLPALQALRDTFPHAHIVLLGKAWHAAFLRDRPGPVDEVVVLPPVPGITVHEDEEVDAQTIENFCAQMRARRFDLAVQLHGGGRYSNPFLKRLGAKTTAGFVTPQSEPLDLCFSYQLLQPQILHLLECVSVVGAATQSAEPRLQLRPSDIEEAACVLPPTQRPLVVLQPGASDPRKCWSPQNFAQVGDHFAALGADIAINGTDAEADAVRSVLRGMRQQRRAHDLTGKLSVAGLAGLISRARLVVSNDTGPAHLARGLAVPSVTVIWLGNLMTYGPLTCALHRVAASWRMDCPVCGENAVGHDCGHPDSFVDDVSVAEVLTHADELFDPPPHLAASLSSVGRAALQPS